VNTVTGLTTIEPELYEMLTAWGATKFQIFHKIGLPHTLPYFFAALKVAYGGAFIGEVIGEMVASEEGLGYVIVVASTRLHTPLAFSALLALLLLGYLLFIFFDTIERKGASWAYRAPGVTM
jgi:NitT/TauT family transport system permease protein